MLNVMGVLTTDLNQQRGVNRSQSKHSHDLCQFPGRLLLTEKLCGLLEY